MKNKKSIVLSAVSAAIFASITVGTTFALFTSNSKTDIQVSSGKINVSATLNDLKVYSAVFTSEDEYHEELQNETREEGGLTEHLFSNGGYAAYNSDQSTLIIDRITPGDLVKFSFDIANDSNVSFKYRFSYVAVDTDGNPETSYLDLIKGMDTSIKEGEATPVTYHGLAKYQTAWEVKSADASLDDVEFSLSLPVDAGNEFQNKKAKILISFEAVQANAYTDGDAEIVLVEEDITSNPVVVVENEDTVISAESATSNLEFTVTVPQNVTYGDNEPVSPDDVLTIEVTDLGKTEEVYTTETSLNFDLVVKVNGEEANNFSEPLPVQIYVGEGLIISSVKHNGVDVTGYNYNTTNGYITFQTNSFSPFEVSFLSGVEVNNDAELRAALSNDNVKVIGVKQNIDATTRYEITRSVRIVGFNNIITVSGDNRVFNLDSVNDAEVSFENVIGVHIDSQKQNYTRGISVYGCSNVTINIHHSSFTCSYYAINVAKECNNVVVNIDDSSLAAGWCAFQTWSSNTTFNISNSTLFGNNDKNYGTSNNFGTIVVESTADNVNINLNNCVINSKYNNPTAEKHNLQWAYLFKGSTCNVNSINCTYILNEEEVEAESFDDLDANNLVWFTSWDAIYGLTFNFNGNVWRYEA